jgi:LmbE family N-acetylglucosaminyl deacetylase
MKRNARVLLAVFAHPDDEAFGSGGTLATYAARGDAVYLVTATRGEAGQIAEPDMGTPATLPQVRERELRCACQTLGIHPPRFLGYLDGHLPAVHQGQAVCKLVRIIRELRPQVVITFGPDGAYGHYDHIAIHHWATAAYELAADPEYCPEHATEGLPPHQVGKLYYRATTLAQVASRARGNKPAAVMMDGVPFYFVGRRPEEITTVIDVQAYAETKRRAILCHETQVGRRSPFSTAPEEAIRSTWFTQETFELARSILPQPGGIETDLFAGLE